MTTACDNIAFSPGTPGPKEQVCPCPQLSLTPCASRGPSSLMHHVCPYASISNEKKGGH